MPGRPILDTIPLSPVATKVNYTWLVFFLSLVSVAIGVVCWTYRKKSALIPNGYLRVNKRRYITAGDYLFPDNDQNATRGLTLTATPQTIWLQVYIDEAKTKFYLKTEIEAIMYSFQTGPPGLGVAWGTAFIAPFGFNANIVFQLTKHSLVALNAAWPDQSVYFTSNEQEELLWTADPLQQLDRIEFFF